MKGSQLADNQIVKLTNISDSLSAEIEYRKEIK